MNSLLKQRKEYTSEQRDYVCSKITDMPWEKISNGLRDFWIEWREKNEKQ